MRITTSWYDMVPVHESDEAVLRDTVRTKAKAARVAKAKPRKNVGVELLLDQEHLTHDGNLVTSHLIAVPKGDEVHWAIKSVFNRHPFRPSLTRTGWHVISDADLAYALPDHDIYWLCKDIWHSASWVQAVVAAIYSEPPAPKREIKNKIPIGR